MELASSFATVTPSFHSDGVESVTLGMISNCESKRQGIFHNDRVSANISFLTDTTKLMNARIRSNIGPVFNDHVAGKGCRVRHDHAVADQTIMSDVRLGHCLLYTSPSPRDS